VHDRGFLILAQNTDTVDYQQCAEVLVKSIRRFMPNMPVAIVTNDSVDHYLYDYVIPLPYGDIDPASKWKLSLDWQVYEASPFTSTIKLESDIYITRDIEHWFDILLNRSLNICTTVRNYQNEVSDCRYYRSTIDNNLLPDTYNAITYFSKSTLAQDFFWLVRDIFNNWATYTRSMAIGKKEEATTDIVYAIAADIIGRDKCILPSFNDMSMIHMKPGINNFNTARWYEYYVYEILPTVFRIGSHPQMYPLHYHHKEFAAIIKEHLDD